VAARHWFLVVAVAAQDAGGVCFVLEGHAMKRILLACVLFAAACAARAQDLDKPLLLVAAPELRGPYGHTALLVVPMQGQHVGFILNRATDVKLATLFPDHAPSAKVADPVYLGGPEGANAIYAMVPRDPGGPSVRLFDDVHVTAHAPSVDRIIEQTPNDARYFAGFVGWRVGELAAEIEAGWWFVSAPDAAVVFSKDTGDAMWGTLLKRFGTRPELPAGMRGA
jgi:putative transcriptional regulator